MSNRDPLDQLKQNQAAYYRWLEAIRTELQRTPAGPSVARRRWTLGVVVALILAGPAAAIAADDALPGDLLYPIKRIAEPIVELFDDDVTVEHRIEEVEGLVDRETDDVVIQQRIDIARDALAETDSPRLERELDRIVDRWIADRATGPDHTSDLSPTTTRPLRPAPTTDRRDQEPGPAPIDTPESTTTTSDRPSATEAPPSDGTTTTVPGDTDDRPPPDDRPRDTP